MVALLTPLLVIFTERVIVSPSFGFALSTVTSETKLEDVTTTVSVKSSTVALVSVWFCVCEIVLVNVKPPEPASTVACNVNVCGSLTDSLEIDQFGALQTPEVAEAKPNVKPVGKISVKTKFETSAPDLFSTVIVYVKTSPTLGVALSTVFVIAISELFETNTFTDKRSGTLFLSVWSPIAAVVVVVIVFLLVPTFTCAEILSSLDSPDVIEPIDHNPEPML